MDALKIILAGLCASATCLAACILRRRWLAQRYKDVNAASIQAEVSQVRKINGQKRGTLTLTANGERLVRIPDIALIELAKQLQEWVSVVDDAENCCEFAFYINGEPETAGLFRMIPRSIGWQINSKRRRARRTIPISLDAHTAMARSIIEQIAMTRAT
ncbi:hypothetical protein [Massilia eburnea]|uniref:DUF7878 domain-containing protein n=1 Tax=Massilia eburnea TaxID=1776165 RepID=UPI003D6B5DBD